MDNQGIVTVAILAKDKGHALPLYLRQIERQTFPAFRINLYIHTNNNNDDMAMGFGAGDPLFCGGLG